MHEWSENVDREDIAYSEQWVIAISFWLKSYLSSCILSKFVSESDLYASSQVMAFIAFLAIWNINRFYEIENIYCDLNYTRDLTLYVKSEWL